MKKDLKPKLTALSKDDLVKIIIDLYNKDSTNRELIEAKFDKNIEYIAFEKYKKQIINEFFPDRGFGKLRYLHVRSALKCFKDISSNPRLIAELMIAHVDYGIKFTKTYGDINEQFYNNIGTAFSNLLKHLSKHKILREYQDQCHSLVTTTRGMGWGFHEELSDLYGEYYTDSRSER